ncbi:hypothetical protein CJ030_MR4G023614 [Morella rubra]|uniref:Uncharacterized protein n=1 Tax=Morella rubra TaxID=262757 RepID=A0A6A1VSM9_9ROSI|nr:hypothetical protein CJ030_MR4G023614 [Morella rubra]
MFTGYLVGYAAFRALFNHSPAMVASERPSFPVSLATNAAGGILGLVGGMLVETLLFIITTSSKDLRSLSSAPELKKNQ